MSINVYIYIYIERERETYRDPPLEEGRQIRNQPVARLRRQRGCRRHRAAAVPLFVAHISRAARRHGRRRACAAAASLAAVGLHGPLLVARLARAWFAVLAPVEAGLADEGQRGGGCGAPDHTVRPVRGGGSLSLSIYIYI